MSSIQIKFHLNCKINLEPPFRTLDQFAVLIEAFMPSPAQKKTRVQPSSHDIQEHLGERGAH
jgi:hypothetical protein